MFESGYRGGYHGSWEREVVRTDHPNWDLLEASKASFRPCMDFEHDHGSQIVIMEAGSYGGDILDESNSFALINMLEGWKNFETHAGEMAPFGAIDWHTGMGNYIQVCINPELVPHDILTDMISTRESFDDYPVLDESDNSEREIEAWNESMEWAIRDVDQEGEFTDEFKTKIFEWVSNNYYGYAEPGWVDSAWVNEGIEELRKGE